MKKNIAMGCLLFILAFLGGRFYLKNLKSPARIDYSHLGGDFLLQHVTGDKSLKDFEGKPIVLYFGFATCPDVCPLSLSKLNQVLDKLPFEKRSLVQKIFVSVDYKRDDAKKVDEYVRFFADDFIGLAGSEKEILNMTKKYAVHFEFVPMKDSALEFTVDHTSRYFLIGKNGKLLNTYSDIINDKSFFKDLSRLL